MAAVDEMDNEFGKDPLLPPPPPTPPVIDVDVADLELCKELKLSRTSVPASPPFPSLAQRHPRRWQQL